MARVGGKCSHLNGAARPDLPVSFVCPWALKGAAFLRRGDEQVKQAHEPVGYCTCSGPVRYAPFTSRIRFRSLAIYASWSTR